MKSVNRLLLAVIWIAALFCVAVVTGSAQSINGACLYALDSTAQQAFFISGNATITTNCSIVVESVGSAAFTMGGTDTLYLGNHAQVGVVGGWQLNGQSIIDTISGQQVQPTIISNPGDPLASVSEPTQGTIVSSAPITYNSSNPPPNNTLSPGVYCGGLNIGNSNGAQYTMSPGTYIMAGGGFSATSSAILVGTGVTIYNTSSTGWGCSASYAYTPITINGQAKVTLSAPTTGALAGIVLFGDRAGCATPGSCQDNINGKATATFNGILYLKSDQLLLNGSSSTGGCMDAVADKITINGDTYSGGNGCFLNSIGISITPATATLNGGQTQQFAAAVTNTYFTDVTWSISPAAAGSIDQTGLYTAPSTISTQQTVTVTATSQADTTKSASATVTVYPPMTISVTPTAATLYAGQSTSFSATVTNAQNTAVTWSISPAGAGTISASGVYTALSGISAQQSVTVTATSQANSALAASATVTLMPKTTPVVTWTTPAAITYGTALSAAQLDATTSVPGTFTYTPAAGTVLTAGSQTLSVTFTPTNTTAYTTATSTVTLMVNQATPTISWATPAAISSGTPLSSTQLDATASVPGTFAYTPAAGTVLPVGSQTLSTTFTPTDTTDYTTATASVTQAVTSTVTISISPSPVTLYANGTQSFAAAVANTSNTAVTWTISPASVGSISAAGLYTAPSIISAQQTVTVTATSQADTTKSASATIVLLPVPCNSNGYSYERTLLVHASQVVNSDQINFPVLVSVSDSTLKSAANGGHVSSQSGFDLIFTSDAAGTKILPFEIETYNPATGTGIFWVQDTLSHTQDTAIYMWYGNASVTASQATPSSTWDSNYLGVWHLSGGNTVSAVDSTANGHDGTVNGATEVTGEIGGAAGFANNGYIDIGSLGNFPAQGTIQFWVQTNGHHGDMYPNAFTTNYNGGNNGIRFEQDSDANSLLAVAFGNASGNFTGYAVITGLVPNVWYPVVVTWDTTKSTVNAYANGALVSSSQSQTYWPTTIPDAAIGVGYNAGRLWMGSVDEVRVSNVIRSADWIATEANNQASPSTFYTLSPENTVVVSPGGGSLTGSQSIQFTAGQPSGCVPSIEWSISPAGVGTISASGLYSAPPTIAAPQTVTVTASDTTDPTRAGSALVDLVPPSPQLTLSAVTQSPYQAGTSQGFLGIATYPSGVAASGLSVVLTVAGTNTETMVGTTDANGVVSFSYAGANVGEDNLIASTEFWGNAIESNALSVSWNTASTNGNAGTIALQDEPVINLESLVGAFTDSSGAVIEPLAIGASPRVFVVPPGATQIQLGIEDAYYEDNWGPGFVVNVNGVPVTVAAGAMPWTWVDGGLNTNYQYGIMDGTKPTIAATDLVAGQTVLVAYKSGLNSPGGLYGANYDANGVPSTTQSVTGVGSNGTFGPIHYMSRQSYPIDQPVSISGIVQNSSGSAMANVPVVLTISGANSGQLESTSDANGNITFTYIGQNAGKDTLTARAVPDGSLTLTSNEITVTWIAPTNLPAGSLTLSPGSVSAQQVGGSLTFTAYAADSFGAPVPNLLVGLNVIGPDKVAYSGVTDSTGHVTIVYPNRVPGTDSVEATAVINNLAAISNVVTVPWTIPAATGSTSGSSGTLNVSINTATRVTLPSTLQLGGTASDSALPSGGTIATTWSMVSGPGTVTFGNASQLSTTASFSEAGSYILQLSATDSDASASVQTTITVNPAPGITQGWIGSPAYNAEVSGVVPITVASGESLQSGVLTYYPASNPGAVTVLNANTTGSGQIGVLDTTQLTNGSYYITLQATDANGNSQYNLVLVSVTGNYKPGRVTATVTDLVVPVKGLPIQIQRMYDSLNASTVGDFGYGWNLGTNVNLTVGPKGDVSFTLGGVRRTFYLTPQGGGFFPFYFAAYTGEPGFHGTLGESAPGCSDLLDILIPDGSLWVCPGGDYYNPPGYVYTDPTGTSYTMTATGTLQSIVDKNGNAVTITASGIRSSTGLSVPFVRDASGRITQITDPQGHAYQYGYDSNGNLASVTYPDTPTSSTYTYDANHLYLSGTDFRSNPLPSSEYYTSSDTDAAGHSLNGRLKSVTDALGETTSYAYDLATYTTTITYPADGNGLQGTATMVYNSLGDLVSSTDPLNHTTANVYDASRNLTSVTDPMGRKTTYGYDSNGNKTSTTYPATLSSTNTTSTTAYNQYSEPTSTTDELGNARTFNYDDYFNPQSVTDSSGTLASFQFNTDGTMQNGAVGYDIAAQASMASHFAYDSNGNLSSRTDALGRVTSYTYDSMGRKLTMTVPVPSGSTAAAATTTYSYDDFGNLTQTAAPLGRTTKSSYDANGNKQSDTDANGKVTNYYYDFLNRLKQTVYPDGTTASKTYDFRGNALTETDQAGHETKYVYDLAGRETSVTRAFGTSDASTTTFAYYDDGRKMSETDNLGHATNYSYDAAGNLTGVSGVGGAFTYGYDNARNRVSMTDGNNNTTTYKYDARKRLTETDYPDGTNTKNTYDGPGNLIKVFDQANNEVDYTYDAANQLQQVTQVSSPNAPNNTTIVGYDADGNPISVQDANVHTTNTSFDLLGEVSVKTLPDNSLFESRTYDPAGNLTKLTHFNGTITNYAYDSLNRLQSRTTQGEAPVSFTYTPTGKRQTMSDASGTTTYSYDDMDRLVTKATPEGTLNYTYDTAGHLATMTSNHANGVSVSYNYDDLGRLETVVDARLPGNSQTTTYGYDTANNVGTVRYPNGVQSTFGYDALNRVTGLSASTGNYTYQRGAVGNLTSASESSGRSITWSYDGINRLTSETITGGSVNGSVSYSLDPVGNRSSASSSLTGVSSGSWNFNADDELTSESYDANGNVIASGGNTFSYNSQNQLVSMNGGTVTIVYDGDGNRVAKSANGVVTRYLVDDLNPTGYAQVVEELSGGVVQRQYSYGLQRISQQQAISNTWTPSYYGYDGGGSVRQLTNAAGAVTDTYDYDAFGNVLNKTGSTPNEMMYRGEQYDSDLGLYYLRARYYNPLTGRFMSRDPEDGKHWDPKALHKYLFAGGDPIDAKDPTGRDIIEFALGTEARYNAVEVGATEFTRDIFLCLLGAAAELKGVLSKDPDLFDVVVGDIGLLGCPVVSPYFPGPID